MTALEDLVAACEEAFVMPPEEGEDEDFQDDEDVSLPPIGITFGMIRRARAELTGEPPR